MIPSEGTTSNAMNKFMFVFQHNIADSHKSINARLKDGQFLVGGVIIDHKVKKSLNLFDSRSRLRKLMVRIEYSQWFSYIIMISIFLNCVAISAYDHSEQNQKLNYAAEQVSAAFTAIYILEAIIKIIADGFIMSEGTYLRDPINVFDFFIIICSAVGFAFNGRVNTSKTVRSFFRILRTLRVFKLLAGFQKVPQLKKQIITLGRALKGLVNVGLFLVFFFILLAIFGLQMFGDEIYNACRITPEPVLIDGKMIWERATINSTETNMGICTKKHSWYTLGGYKCPKPYTCGSYLDYNLPLEDDGVKENIWLNYDIATWKNIWSSFLAVFQMVTQDGWSLMMYSLIQSSEFFLPVIFAITIIMLGSYFLMNLMLAVIMDEYIKSEQSYETELRERKKLEQDTVHNKFFNLHLFKQLSEVQNIGRQQTVIPEPKLTIPLPVSQDDQDPDQQDQSSSSESDQEEVKLPVEAKPEQNSAREPDSLIAFTEHPFRAPSSLRSRASSENSDFNSKKLSIRFDVKSTAKTQHERQKTFRSKNPLLGRMSRGMSVMLTRKQQELIAMQKEINEINDDSIRKKINHLHNVLQVATDEKQSNVTYEEKWYLHQKLESEQETILNDLQRSLKTNIRQEKYTNFGIKEENMLGAFIAKTIKEEISEEDKEMSNESLNQSAESVAQRSDANLMSAIRKRRRKSGNIDEIGFKMKDYFQQTSKEKDKSKTQQLSVLQAKAKRAFGMQKAFLKREIQEQRIQGNFILETSYKIEQSKLFNFFISVCIIGNTILLALDKFPKDVKQTLNHEFVNFIFFIVFVSEMVIKMLSNGFKLYFKNKYNLFDFVVILISVIDLVLQNIELNLFNLKTIRALRIFRLLRVFKLAKVWKSFSYLISTISNTIKKLSYFLVLVWLFWFTYAIIGKEFFAFKSSFTNDLTPLKQDYDFSTGHFKKGYAPDFNFDTFLDSSITVFTCIAGGSWSTIFYDTMRSPDTSPYLTVPFFYTLYIGGKNILFQLFLAILLNEFDERSVTQAAEEEIKDKKEGSIFQQMLGCLKKTGRKMVGDEKTIEQSNSVCFKCLRKQKKTQPTTESDDAPEWEPNGANCDGDQQGGLRSSIKDRQKNLALGCLSKSNPVRRFCIWLTEETEEKAGKLDSIIWIFIAISCIELAFQSPIIDKNSKFANAIQYIDYVMTAAFGIEMFIKVIASGLLLNGTQSYLRQPSNVLDLFVVIMSIVDATSTKDFGFVKIMRMAKLGRPLKLVFRNEKLKISIQALISGTPQILNLLMLVILIYTIFAIVAVNFFEGRMFDCMNDSVKGIDQHLHEEILDVFDCLNYGGEWIELESNFNNFFSAFEQMFMMAQQVSWQTTMLASIKSNGVSLTQKQNPPYESGIYYSIFFMSWIVFGGFFIQNLFVGVVISQYNRQSERLGKNFLLTEQQKNWIETKLLITKIKPKTMLDPPTNRIRMFFFKFIHWENYRTSLKPMKVFGRNLSDLFEYFIMITIGLNTLILCLKWPNMSEKAIQGVDFINYICTGVFIVEALIKIIAQGHHYFKDGWNIFDFIIVVGSLAFISPTSKKQKNAITMIRAFRVGRVLKLFSKLKQLQGIFQTVLATIAALMNVGMLMLLIIYMFAIVGVEFFGDIKLNPPMTKLMNFQTMPKAFLTLFTVATGDGWDLLLQAISMKKSAINNCIENPTYQDYVDNGKQTIGCGSPRFATIYLFSFVFVISIVFLNLFIAIILQGYFNQIQKETDNDIKNKTEHFRDEWAKLDPAGAGKIQNENLKELLFALGKDLGMHESYKKSPSRQEQYIENLSKNMEEHARDEEKGWYFTEVLDNVLLYFVIKTQVRKEMENQGIEIGSDDDMENLPGENQNNSSTFNIIQTKIEHLEEGLNQKDAQLVKQLRKQSSANISNQHLFGKKNSVITSLFIDDLSSPAIRAEGHHLGSPQRLRVQEMIEVIEEEESNQSHRERNLEPELAISSVIQGSNSVSMVSEEFTASREMELNEPVRGSQAQYESD